MVDVAIVREEGKLSATVGTATVTVYDTHLCDVLPFGDEEMHVGDVFQAVAALYREAIERYGVPS